MRSSSANVVAQLRIVIDFAPPPPRAAARNAQCLRPELVIRAEFAGWTGDGLVRQAAYKGIELEKDPRKVMR